MGYMSVIMQKETVRGLLAGEEDWTLICYFAFVFIREGNSQSVINVRIALKSMRQNKAEEAQ